MRGPGKKKQALPYLFFNAQRLTPRRVKGPSSDKSLEIRVTTRLQEKEGLCDEQSNSTNAEDQSEVTKATPQSSRGVVTFDSSTGIESRLRQLYPVFLHPENIMRVQQEIIRASQKAQRSPEGFAPLPPKDIVHYALRNTYDDIMNICPIFDLPMLQKRNAEQQAIDNIRPAGNPARWSILNTWISLGIRLRTALGSEDQFKCVVDSYYRNAVLVLPDLILHPITTESVQALLLMSVFAENVEDQRSFVMLVTNSARQIELLARSCSGVVDRSEREIYERLLDFARVQDKKVAEKYGMLSMSNSLSI
jgi:hypothetical protein